MPQTVLSCLHHFSVLNFQAKDSLCKSFVWCSGPRKELFVVTKGNVLRNVAKQNGKEAIHSLKYGFFSCMEIPGHSETFREWWIKTNGRQHSSCEMKCFFTLSPSILKSWNLQLTYSLQSVLKTYLGWKCYGLRPTSKQLTLMQLLVDHCYYRLTTTTRPSMWRSWQ